MQIAGDTLRFARRIGVNALIVLVPLMLLFGYMAWHELRGPTPADLCDRIDELTHAVASDPLREQCISTYEGLRDLSDSAYREFALCIEHATSAAHVAACGR